MLGPPGESWQGSRLQGATCTSSTDVSFSSEGFGGFSAEGFARGGERSSRVPGCSVGFRRTYVIGGRAFGGLGA